MNDVKRVSIKCVKKGVYELMSVREIGCSPFGSLGERISSTRFNIFIVEDVSVDEYYG